MKMPEPMRLEMIKGFKDGGMPVPLDIMSDDELVEELDRGSMDVSSFRNGTNHPSSKQLQTMVGTLRRRS